MSVKKADKKAIALAGQLITDKQRRLVDNLFVPGTTQREAAIAAGYSTKSADQQASRALRLPYVVEYIDACVGQGAKIMAMSALGVVKELSESGKSPYVRLQAAQDILDRAGHKPVEKSMVAMKGELTVNIDLS
jgi:hypothetical protein|tara:strand:+ start:9214 stop:9615 length:402 start_codon:yes stop_codon:yes gene_type:complete